MTSLSDVLIDGSYILFKKISYLRLRQPQALLLLLHLDLRLTVIGRAIAGFVKHKQEEQQERGTPAVVRIAVRCDQESHYNA